MELYDLLGNRPVVGNGQPGATLVRGVAGFWQLRGQRVFEYGGVLWGQYKHSVYISLPFHFGLDPAPHEIRSLLLRNITSCVRFPSINQPGVSTGLYYCCPQGYDIGAVARKMRPGVRSGLDHCIVKLVPPDELEALGLQLNLETMKRQNRFDPEFGNPASWKQLVDAVRKCPDISVMGAYVDGRLSAYKISCRDCEWIHELYMASRTDEMALHTNCALDFVCLTEAGRDPTVKAVGNWYPSNGQKTGIDSYKEKLGFQLLPHSLCFHLHPVLSAAFDNQFAQFIASKSVPAAARVLEGVRLSHNPPMEMQDPCQQEDAPGFSRTRRPHVVFLAWWYSMQLRKQGFAAAFRKAAAMLRKFWPRTKPVAPPRPQEAGEMLLLQPGEWVQVKTEAAIQHTLDKRGKNRGLLFTNEMRAFYGRKFRVLKRVERIFLEESRQHRKLKSTVILEGVHCSGSEMECDRACFLFWKEIWLRRATPPPAPEPSLFRVLTPVSTLSCMEGRGGTGSQTCQQE